MTTITQEAIRNAFEKYIDYYATERGWSVRSRLELCAIAEKAFAEHGSPVDFAELYNELKSTFRVFRGGRSCWSAEEAWPRLKALSSSVRNLSLSTVKDDNWPDIWKTVSDVRSIKLLKDDLPSLVAISKFLHFWNPKLFVIFDSEVMEDYAFRHQWIQLPQEGPLAKLCQADLHSEPRIAKYVRVLHFASKVVRANPRLKAELVDTVRRKARDVEQPEGLEPYEAVAFEWCILGLVELPPCGVTIT